MRVKVGLAALAVLAMTVTATVGGASADPVAQTAGLKKCLKKAKRIQDPVKRKKAKKKCRKKFGVNGTTPTNPTGGSPLVRATLTWSGGGTSTDYDLYVFSGTTVASTRLATNPIPSSTFSSNVKGGSGTETFTDLVFKVPGRTFQFGVCHQDGGSDGTSYSITYVTADGVSHTDSRSGGSDGFNAIYSGGAPALQQFPVPCPAP
jgi:hypothetical protein